MGWIVVTGGAGYIGSHVCVALLDAGHSVVIVDNFCNSSPRVVERILELSPNNQDLLLHQVDLKDPDATLSPFEQHQVDAVIHLAGLKAVGESVKDPLLYYSTNLEITWSILKAMRQFNVGTLVYSSSATVYGQGDKPVAEDHPLNPQSPYGRSKYFQEAILQDCFTAKQLDRVCVLRYFNPVGAHLSGRIGEEPRGMPNNLMPAIAQCAIGRLPGRGLCVFGDDYDTPDGTGVRDYIHVMDLARGHVSALEYLGRAGRIFEVFNLGTGIGYSVLQVIKTFSLVSGKELKFEVVGRRAGDVPTLLAAVHKSEKMLKFKAQHRLEEMCRDHWQWQSHNPNGY